MALAAKTDFQSPGLGLRGHIRWTPHPVIVAIRDNKDYTRVPFYSYYTTITGWGVLQRYNMRCAVPNEIELLYKLWDLRSEPRWAASTFSFLYGNCLSAAGCTEGSRKCTTCLNLKPPQSLILGREDHTAGPP